jgi:DNA repair protein RadC
VYRAGRRREPLASSAAVFARFGPVLGGREDEEMWVMSVDARNLVRGCRKVALGGVHACGMHPRNILRTALLEGAVGMVIVHNHPSGNPAPSMDDILMTKRIMAAADVAGITLVDHLIVGANDDYRSMLDLGFIPERAPADVRLPNRPYGTRLRPPPGDP